MIIIAERINATRKRIGKAVADRDAAFIAREAKLQADAGATHIDCNAGRNPATEVEDLQWMIGVVQDAVDLPICIDSPNAQAIAAALKRVRKTPMINSVTAEKAKLERILPLARGSTGAPGRPVHGRLGHARRRRRPHPRGGAGPRRGRAKPASPRTGSTSTRSSSRRAPRPREALAAIETVRHIMKEFGGAHTTCGLSNISFGLPSRNTLNRTFLAMLMAAGLDGVIMDPTEPHMMSTVLAGARHPRPGRVVHGLHSRRKGGEAGLTILLGRSGRQFEDEDDDEDEQKG